MDTETAAPAPLDLISRPEAGRILSCGPAAVDGMISRGELRAWRIGERVKLSRREVIEYLLRGQGWVSAAEHR